MRKETMEELKEYRGWEEVLDTWNKSEAAIRVYVNHDNKEVFVYTYGSLNEWDEFNNHNIKQLICAEGGCFSTRRFHPRNVDQFIKHIINRKSRYEF